MQTKTRAQPAAQQTGRDVPSQGQHPSPLVTALLSVAIKHLKGASISKIL